MNSVLKKTALSTALVAALGVGTATTAQADIILDLSWSGLFTMLDPAGKPLSNTSLGYYDPDYSNWLALRTSVSGTMQFNLTTGAGSATLVPFDFFNGSLPAEAVGISMQAIGDGFGNPGTLVLGNMLFNWNGNNGIPVSIVLDAAGMFGALNDGFSVSESISGVGALPASNGIKLGQIPIGPTPVATTTWNTTSTCTVVNAGDCMGVSPSGTFPLIANSIGGTPMIDGPFTGYNANFDITNIHIDAVTDTGTPEVPVPAAVWLFGSGLMGLVGVARRRKA